MGKSAAQRPDGQSQLALAAPAAMDSRSKEEPAWSHLDADRGQSQRFVRFVENLECDLPCVAREDTCPSVCVRARVRATLIRTEFESCKDPRRVHLSTDALDNTWVPLCRLLLARPPQDFERARDACGLRGCDCEGLATNDVLGVGAYLARWSISAFISDASTFVTHPHTRIRVNRQCSGLKHIYVLMFEGSTRTMCVRAQVAQGRMSTRTCQGLQQETVASKGVVGWRRGAAHRRRL